MREEEYIKTLHVNGIDVKLGIDDYGQCYFIEYTKDGKDYEETLGTYNTNYMEEIYSLLDEKFNTLYQRKTLSSLLTDDEDDPINRRILDNIGHRFSPEDEIALNKYLKIFEEEYNN